MEFRVIDNNKGPINVSGNLKDLLLEFTLNCLLDQPTELYGYASEYFSSFLNKNVSIEYDENDTVQQSDLDSTAYTDYTRVRSRVVYSEAYNPEIDDSDEESDIEYEKTKEQRELLWNVVTKCLLFRALDKDQTQRVINVMFPRECKPMEIIIKQYDDGDNFYIIEHGLFDVLIATEPEATPLKVFTYENSGSFGELALMYNMPRAATIRAASAGKLWAMDRQTFRRIVLRSAFKKRKMYEELISKVPMLQELTPYERMNVADALIPKTSHEGDIIISQGDEADGMYFIEKGKVSVSIFDPVADAEFVVANLSEGDYFGELALVTHNQRAATVTATTDVKLAFLDVEAFERLLGPCMNVMSRNIETYRKQIETIFGNRPSRILSIENVS